MPSGSRRWTALLASNAYITLTVQLNRRRGRRPCLSWTGANLRQRTSPLSPSFSGSRRRATTIPPSWPRSASDFRPPRRLLRLVLNLISSSRWRRSDARTPRCMTNYARAQLAAPAHPLCHHLSRALCRRRRRCGSEGLRSLSRRSRRRRQLGQSQKRGALTTTGWVQLPQAPQQSAASAQGRSESRGAVEGLILFTRVLEAIGVLAVVRAVVLGVGRPLQSPAPCHCPSLMRWHRDARNPMHAAATRVLSVSLGCVLLLLGLKLNPVRSPRPDPDRPHRP